MERLYQHRPWMVESMYVVGTRPKSLGEGVFVQGYSLAYDKVWQFWRAHPQQDWGVYQWREGYLRHVGRKMRNPRTGFVFWVPIPPIHMASA